MVWKITDEFCEEYPHQLIPTPGYWIECSRQKITGNTNVWDEQSESGELNLEFINAFRVAGVLIS